MSAIIITFVFGQHFEITDESRASTFLVTNAELLVTILAVTMSFTVLGLQFLAESYTPRALARYLRDKIIVGFPVLYIILISLNLISAAVPMIIPPIKFLQFAVIGTIFSLVYLVAFVYHVIRKIQPERVIFETSNDILSDVWKQIIRYGGRVDLSSSALRPFIVLEQIMVKAVTNNDIFSFAHGLDIWFRQLGIYLDEIQKEFDSDKDPRKRMQNSYFISEFFFKLFTPLISESLSHGREQFIIQYQWHMFKQMTSLYKYRNHHTIGDFWKQLDYLGHKIFNAEMISAANSYISQLHMFMKLELETLKKTKQDWPKDSLGLRYVKDDEQIVNHILANDFDHRINSLTDFGIIVANKRMENLLNLMLSDLREIIETIVQINDGTTRRGALYSVMQCVKKIHETSANNGMHNTVWTTHWLPHYIEKMDKRRTKEIKGFTEDICKLSLYSVEHGEYHETMNIGYNGRILVEFYPDLAIIVLDTLEKCFEILKNEKDDEVRISWTKELVKEVESVQQWNKNNHPQIAPRVKEILKKHPQES